MQSTTNPVAKRPVLIFLRHPLDDAELKSVEDRGYELPTPQMPILEASVTEDDITWFRQQAFVGKVELMPRDNAELMAMFAEIQARERCNNRANR